MKSIKYILSVLCIAVGLSACQMPEYEYGEPTNKDCPNPYLYGYTISVFSSAMTDVQHPTFGVSAQRYTFGSTWVTRECGFEPSSSEITVTPYSGNIDVLRTCAMTVTATAEGSIRVIYPTPIGSKTSTTVMVLIDSGNGAVSLVPAND